MAATVETQRLISMSLGKIAQSRGQRGGINLHKNLLVATVLHKARTAYMMETYSYHQQQQKQKLHQQEQLLQQQQQQQRQLEKQEAEQSKPCVADSEPFPASSRDVEMGQSAIATPLTSETGSLASPAIVPPPAVETPVVESAEGAVLDKENHPPADTQIHEGCDVVRKSESRTDVVIDHLVAANQLSQDASQCSDNSACSKQLTSGTPTCNGILKRRRDNPPAVNFEDSPATKKARVTHDDVSSSLAMCQFTPIYTSSDLSETESLSDESDSESDCEVSMVHSDSPQISNLVTIFNSGFTGLCANNKVSDKDNTFIPLSKLRPESPTPSSFSRNLSEPSLMCSSEVGRMGSIPSAIVLSA